MSNFVLTLDTHAPQAAVADVAREGIQLRVTLALNEPGIVSAILILPDSTQVPMTVSDNEVIADLPVGLQATNATLRLTVRDIVDNEATVDLELILAPGAFDIVAILEKFPLAVWSFGKIVSLDIVINQNVAMAIEFTVVDEIDVVIEPESEIDLDG